MDGPGSSADEDLDLYGMPGPPKPPGLRARIAPEKGH